MPGPCLSLATSFIFSGDIPYASQETQYLQCFQGLLWGAKNTSPKRHSGEILVRLPIYLNVRFLIWYGASWTTKLLIWSLRLSPETLWRKLFPPVWGMVPSWKKGRVPSAGWGWASGRELLINAEFCCFLRVFLYIWVCWCQGNKLTLTSNLSSTVSVAGLCAIGQLFLQEIVLKCRIFFFLSCLTGHVYGSHRGHYKHSILKGKAHEQMCFYPFIVHSAL